MTDDTDHRACLERIVLLTREALDLCDRCGDHLMAAKLADSHELALDRLRGLDAG